jgi:hypothetical protein
MLLNTRYAPAPRVSSSRCRSSVSVSRSASSLAYGIILLRQRGVAKFVPSPSNGKGDGACDDCSVAFSEWERGHAQGEGERHISLRFEFDLPPPPASLFFWTTTSTHRMHYAARYRLFDTSLRSPTPIFYFHIILSRRTHVGWWTN